LKNRERETSHHHTLYSNEVNAAIPHYNTFYMKGNNFQKFNSYVTTGEVDR